VDCSNGTTTILPCDDGDACTDGDVQTVLDADGTICVPCAGALQDCSTGTTSLVTCDDGNPFTINDEQTILDCDGAVCIPCMGTPVDCSNGATTVSGCDDGNPCTINDTETILNSDGTICVPCAGEFLDCEAAEITITICQTIQQAEIGPDRNDWSHANLPMVNEGYLHNFTIPDLPCSSNTTVISSLEIGINIESLTSSAACNGIPIYGNVLLNCALTPPGVCTIIQDVLTPGCGNFGGGATTPGDYAMTLTDCNSINPNDVIGVDLIPATDFSATCPSNGNAITDGSVVLEYEICLTLVYVPQSCVDTMRLPCDDGNPCTENDEVVVESCDPAAVCEPCQGIPIDCDNGTVSTVACDDGNPCTINDVRSILDCDGSVCIPCAGVVQDCASGTTSVVTCDDGNPNTLNDVRTILDCDGSICIPCTGVPVDCSTGATSTVPCDDNDPCTDNDLQTVLDSDGSICVPCAGTLQDCMTGATEVVPCNDGDASTANDQQTILSCDGTVCTPCMGVPCDFSVSLGPDRSIVIGDSLRFGLIANAVVDSVIWQDVPGLSCYNCLDPVVKPTQTSTFSITAIDENGCEASDNITIIVDETRKIYIPNVFSPNGDGINDDFGIQGGANIRVIRTFNIYNRWGAILFNATNQPLNSPEGKWQGDQDGQPVEAGVYIYFAEVEFTDGHVEKVSGEVLVMK
jgi:gliding motility-associated-like protein